MFTDFLWQLIPQLKCPLFQAFFPSLKSGTAVEAHDVFEQLRLNISCEPPENVLAAPHLQSPQNTPDTNCTQHPQLQDKLFQASTGKLRLIYAVATRNDRAAASAAEGWRGEQWVCQHSPSWVQIQKQACCLLLWKYHSTGSHLRIYMDSSSNRITVFGTESLPKECTMYPEIPRNHDYIYSQNNPLFQVLAMV